MKVTNETQALAHEILAYWLRFNKHDQATWVGDPYSVEIETQKLLTGAEVNVCNTTLCAAGTAVFLSRSPGKFKWFARHSSFDDWMEEGAKLLGLNNSEAHTVFLADEKSAKRLMRAIASGSKKKFAKAVKKRKSFDENEDDDWT